MLNTLTLVINHPVLLHAEAKTDTLVPDFTSTLPSWPGKNFVFFDVGLKEGFMDHVRAPKCLEIYDSNAFTMLQRAALNDDMELIRL